MSSSRPKITVIFCDDIREEMFKKLTYVGVYESGVVFAGEEDVILAQFCVNVVLEWPLNTAPDQAGEVLLHGASHDLNMNIPLINLRSIIEPNIHRQADTTRVYFRLSPLLLVDGDILRISHRMDGEDIEVGRCRFKKVDAF